MVKLNEGNIEKWNNIYQQYIEAADKAWNGHEMAKYGIATYMIELMNKDFDLGLDIRETE